MIVDNQLGVCIGARIIAGGKEGAVVGHQARDGDLGADGIFEQRGDFVICVVDGDIAGAVRSFQIEEKVLRIGRVGEDVLEDS